MASYALLLGTKAGKRTLIADGQPVEIRRQFKTITAEDGFEKVEVVDKHQGQIRSRKFAGVAPAKKATKRSK
jgi:hypothetical protein